MYSLGIIAHYVRKLRHAFMFRRNVIATIATDSASKGELRYLETVECKTYLPMASACCIVMTGISRASPIKVMGIKAFSTASKSLASQML